MPGSGGVAFDHRRGTLTKNLGELVQNLLDVLPRFPAWILGHQDGHQQRKHATHHGIQAARKRPAGRRRKQHHQKRLQPQLGGENGSAVQEPGQQDREEKYDGGLPDPGAQPVKQQITNHDAQCAAQAYLYHPAQPGIA
ncbi:hypothetical protein PJL18_02826 [Paenarthrobacter nicotinovorans]|nr:hypothetical protein [Paenarthrobacter nicotinovorans]